jgi:hypothetical protein
MLCSTDRLETYPMNGAQSLIRTLVGGGVDVCFANPGTSEMHFVASLDAVPEMRAVLALFEGVVTGAADGYGRMAERPAATLLHLGPGMANGLAAFAAGSTLATLDEVAAQRFEPFGDVFSADNFAGRADRHGPDRAD